MAFAAHKAVYDLTLGKSSGTKAPTGLTGQIALEFTGSACEGYTTNFRQINELQPAEGSTRVSDMRTTTFESGDAKTFRFHIKTLIDSIETEDVDGKASRAADGGMAVSLTRPKQSKFDRESNIVFPTEHLRVIIAAARQNTRLVETKAYDGSETGEKIYFTLTVIGQKVATSAPEPELTTLQDVPRWPVTISYFDSEKGDAKPDYVLGFDLYDNGVSRALRIDYGDFTVLGKLVKFEPLKTAACAK